MSEDATSEVDNIATTNRPQVPDSWSWTTIDESLQIIDYRGRTPPFSETGIPHLRSSNIKNGRIIWEKLAFLSEEDYETYMTRGLPTKVDVLFTTEAPLGEVALAPDTKFSLAQRLLVLRPPQGILLPSFLAFQLMAPFFQSFLRFRGTGTTVTGISSRNFKSLSLCIAPLGEQGRIVAKIEELFSDLDAGVAALKRAKAKLKRYRAAVLKAAVEGKLTEEWRAKHPGTEPASKLLARILTERSQKWEADQIAKFAAAKKEPPKNWKEKYVEPKTPDTTNLPELPEGWRWAKLDQLITYLRNGYFQSPSGADTGTPILRINAVRPMRVDLAETRFLNEIEGSVDDYFIENGDLLFTRYNGSVDLLGVAGMVRGCTEKVLHPDKLIRVKMALGEPMPSFCEIAANVGVSRRHMAGRARTTAGQTGISGPDVREMPIPLPPLDEQSQIVGEVAEKLSQIEAAAIAIDHDLLRAARLRQSILKQAFEGKLVPQDPKDEPASVLLERLRASRSAHEGNGKAATPTRPRGRRAKSKQVEGADE